MELQEGEKALDGMISATCAPNQLLKYWSAIDAGTGSSNRQGATVRYTNLRVTGTLQQENTYALNQLARITIVYDRMANANGVLPVVTDVLINDSSTAGFNRDKRDRFYILYDAKYLLEAKTSSTILGAPAKVDFTLDLKGIPGIFRSTSSTGGYGNILSGAILLMCTNDVGAGGSQASFYGQYTLGFLSNYGSYIPEDGKSSTTADSGGGMEAPPTQNTTSVYNGGGDWNGLGGVTIPTNILTNNNNDTIPRWTAPQTNTNPTWYRDVWGNIQWIRRSGFNRMEL